jgi:hypothetical protein
VLQISSQNSLVSRLTFATSAGPAKPFYFQQFLDLTAGVAKLRSFATETASWEPYTGFLFH